MSRLALLLLLVVTATTGLIALPAPPASAGFAEVVLAEAARHQGKPYRYGATGPDSFDCSGFTGFVYGRLGISLPRTSDQQYAALPKVAQGGQVVGDLIFTYDAGGIYHVGIYAGNHQMWAAPKTGDVVRLQTIWTNQYKVARPVPEVTRKHWIGLGGASGPLGHQVTAESATPNGSGRYTHFQAGSVYWTPPVGPREVRGAIRDTWSRLGWENSALGYPTTDETGTPDRVGRFNHFQGGSIYWTPGTGARELRGAIRGTWSRLGWENGPLGYPVTNETGTRDGVGRFNQFQHGSIYWSPMTSAREVRGAIQGTWMRSGAEAGAMGYPLTDETRTADGVGRFNHFQRGSIYWTPSTGAHEVPTAFRDVWARLDWERSPLGYPTSGERRAADGTGRSVAFQGGAVHFSPATGYKAVHGAVYKAWLAEGAEAGTLGYPTVESRPVAGGTAVDFQRGTITVDSAGRTTVVRNG